ncbi:MAG: ankyrin repeat domain-containing protein [Tatlockia sp.]|nr:ankyrin repeat domain-containing protein [Tatlockia sp.]
MTLQILRKKINNNLEFLSNEVERSLEQLGVALILKHCLVELEKLPSSKERENLKKTIIIAFKNHLLYSTDDILKYYSNQLLLSSITNNDSELLEALIALRPEVVNSLYSRKDTLNRQDSALILAVTHAPPRIELIKLLVKVKGISINYGPFRTALDEAVVLGNIEIINILLEAGATATQKTFQLACSMGHFEIAKLLVKANPDAPFDYNDVLMASIKFGSLPIISYLVDVLGADVNHVEEYTLGKNKQVNTPLSLAIQHKKDSIAVFLKEAGALGQYIRQPAQDKKSDEIQPSEAISQTKNSNNKSTFFNIKPVSMKKTLVTLLDNYLTNRTEKVDEKGKTKKYLYSYIPEFFQKSFEEKLEAVTVLQKALKGEKVDLASHLSTLRNGNLGKELRAFIKAGKANSLVNCEVDTISEFVAALDAKVNPKNTSEPLMYN